MTTEAGRRLLAGLKAYSMQIGDERVPVSQAAAAEYIAAIEAEVRAEVAAKVRALPPHMHRLSDGEWVEFIRRDAVLALLDAPAPSETTHGITDPNAPLGWQCGDPACPSHGVSAVPEPPSAEPEGLDAETLAEAMHFALAGAPGLGDRPDLWRDAGRVAAAEYARLREKRSLLSADVDSGHGTRGDAIG